MDEGQDEGELEHGEEELEHGEEELEHDEEELELDEEEQEDKDKDFCLMDEEIVSGDAIFIGQVCAIDDIIKQINLQSRCKATFNCKGIYQRVSITRSRLGGAIEMEYRCSRCKKRGFSFRSSPDHVDLPSTVVAVALQVAFIAAGLTYRKYQLALAAGLGLKVVSNKSFNNTLRYMRPVVKKQLDTISVQEIAAKSSSLHYEVSTNLGLVHANLTRLIQADPNYHWYIELYGGLNLPTFSGMSCFLKQENSIRLKKTEVIKTEESKRQRNKWKTMHRTIEQEKIKKNLKQRKIYHTYGDEEEVINVEEKDDSDDSLHCQRKRKIVQEELENNIKLRKVHEDENENNDSDDTLIEECCRFCDCPNVPSHIITCPLHFSRSRDDRLLVEYIDKDVEIIAQEDHNHKPCCILPTHSWMEAVSNYLSSILGKEVDIGDDNIIPTKLAEISPLCRHRIRGDGNCLFRTISKFVLGREKDHMYVRHGIVRFMELPNNIFEFESYFGFGTGLRYKSLHDYINQTKMNLSSTYGTDLEIIAFATMVQSNVMVYMCEDHAWRRYEPAFINDTCLTYTENFVLHIIHSNEHYDLCVPPVS